MAQITITLNESQIKSVLDALGSIQTITLGGNAEMDEISRLARSIEDNFMFTNEEWARLLDFDISELNA